MHITAAGQITAGDSLDETRALAAYPASAGWTLTYRLVPRAADGQVVTLVTTAAGDAYRLQASAATTAGWAPGPYSWVAWVTRGDDSHTVSQGSVTVAPNPRELAPGADGRSLARRTLDQLVEAKAKWDLSKGNQRRYRINDREMEFKNAAEVERLIRWWSWQVYLEDAAAAGHAGGRFYMGVTR